MTISRVPASAAAGNLDSFSRDYLQRMYAGSSTRYEDRLRAIGFVGKTQVLDAGCGFGQWSLAMAGLNHRVWAVDIDCRRLRFGAKLVFTYSPRMRPDRWRW